MQHVIVCDKCGYEPCNVSEILPPSQHITMKDYAALNLIPHGLTSWSFIHQDHEYQIVCPECGHQLTYIEHVPRLPPSYEGEGP